MRHQQRGGFLFAFLLLFCLIGLAAYFLLNAARSEEIWEAFTEANGCQPIGTVPNVPGWQVTLSGEGIFARQIEVPGRQLWLCADGSQWRR